MSCALEIFNLLRTMLGEIDVVEICLESGGAIVVSLYLKGGGVAPWLRPRLVDVDIQIKIRCRENRISTPCELLVGSDNLHSLYQ